MRGPTGSRHTCRTTPSPRYFCAGDVRRLSVLGGRSRFPCRMDYIATLNLETSSSLLSVVTNVAHSSAPEAKTTPLRVLGEVRVQTRFRLASYVVMPEHVHLLIEEQPAQRPRRVGTHVT
jgi:hypothetical protein